MNFRSSTSLLSRLLQRQSQKKPHSTEACSSNQFLYESATIADLVPVLDMVFNRFLRDEPHHKAQNDSVETMFNLCTHATVVCLQSGKSMKVIDKSRNGDMIGVFLSSVVSIEDSKTDKESLLLNYEQMTPNERRYWKLIQENRKIFDDYQKTLAMPWKKYLYHDIMTLKPEYQRKYGISQKMLNFYDHKKLAQEGFEGITTECTNIHSKRMLDRGGFECIGELPKSLYKRIGFPGDGLVAYRMIRDLRHLK